jgi:glycosyltransferase involved in cell wall biosynthesis
MPDVSIVLPIYNVEKYIKKCLESITAQNFKNFEVLCIDDCGTDNSIKITQEFVQKDSF